MSSTHEVKNNSELLQDIEQIGNKLYLNKPSPNDSSKSKSKAIFEDKHKKSSIWKWKPLKALNHFRSHRFNCCFYLHVHSIQNLPTNFNDLSLTVNWKRKDISVKTRASKVNQGVAEFEETLMHRSSVYGNGNGPQNSAKYEPKLFLLDVNINGAPLIELGKHWIDLTRLFPLSLEELMDEEEKVSEKWKTSFKLTGKGKGAIIYVSFSFSLVHDNSIDPHCFVKLPHSLKGYKQRNSSSSLQIREEKLDDLNDSNFPRGDLEPHKPELNSEITVNGHEEKAKPIVENIDVEDIFKDIEENGKFEEIEQVGSDSVVLDSVKDTSELVRKESYVSRTLSFRQSKMVRSHSLDDVTESIADEFLRMLDNEIESPRGRLLREFEEESSVSGNNSIFEFRTQGKEMKSFSFVAEEKKVTTQSLISNMKMIESSETEALMKEWDLDEKDFLKSDEAISSGGFGSPVHILA